MSLARLLASVEAGVVVDIVKVRRKRVVRGERERCSSLNTLDVEGVVLEEKED